MPVSRYKHNIIDLFNEYCTIVPSVPLNNAEMTWVQAFLCELETIDRASNLFRYPIKDGYLKQYNDSFLDIVDKDLWISVKPMIEHYAKEMGYDLNIVQLADNYLFDLSKLDKEGDKFRYPTDYGLAYSLQLTRIDYFQAVYWLIGIFNFVQGCSDMLDVAYEYECDMRSEYL